MVFLQKSREAVETIGPEFFVAIEPFHGVAHRLGLEPAGDDAAGFFARDEAGVRQHVEMLHDRRQRDRKRRAKLADREIRPLGEPHHQRAARRVSERGEGAVEGSGRKLNHVVKYSGC